MIPVLLKCFGCKAEKPPEAFGQDKRRPSGLQARCKPCINRFGRKNRKKNRERIRKRQRESYYRIPNDPVRKANRLRLRFKINLKHVFGIDEETYARLAHAQELKCAICRSALLFDNHTHLDHDHATGTVRGLLCRPCNILLGGARDDPRILHSAVEYLWRHRAT